jgi:DNA topoisomerase-2
LIFKEEDNAILNYLDDDGQQIEPEYYIPIIPMILVNGGIGIGTGYSTNIPQFDPSELINICKIICNVIKMSGTVAKKEDDLETINDTINILEINDITPYYLGFKGSIIKAEKNSYISKGVYRWVDDSTVEITELPIGTWTEDYKELLENMITNGLNNLKYIENHYTSKNVKFILHFNTSVKATMESNFETLFKLQSSKNLSINNIHLFNKEGAIQKYDSAIEIIKEWSETRILKYFERKNYQIKNLEKEAMVLSNKMRFILDVIAGNIKIMNKKLKEITLRLIELKYPPINTESDKPAVAGAAGAVGEEAEAAGEEADAADDESGAGAGAVNYKHYNYLLKMPISQLTYDRKVILEREYNELDEKLRNLKNTNIEDLWLNDLNELEKEWEQHRNNILKEYENDRLGIVDAKVVKKKVKK